VEDGSRLSFSFRDITAEDASGLVRLANSALETSWTEEYVRWKYFQGPAGPGYGTCAEMGEQVVAFYGGVPVKLKLGGRIVAAAQAADAMVHPRMRRQGLFGQVGSQTILRADRAGAALVFAFPNNLSLAGSVKKLGFAHPGEIPRYVKILAPDLLVANSGWKGLRAFGYRIVLEIACTLADRGNAELVSGICVREVGHFDRRFDELWAQTSQAFPIAVVRDASYLNWRYARNPLVRYSILIAERGSDLVGYAVLSLRDLATDQTVALAELLVTPDDEQAGLALLAGAITVARRFGGGCLQCWMLPDHAFYRGLLERSGFVFWPASHVPRLLRYTTPFIVRPRPGHEPISKPVDLQQWFVSMGDHDYY
jgi:predicted N-acetyltransferase YhbS